MTNVLWRLVPRSQPYYNDISPVFLSVSQGTRPHVFCSYLVCANFARLTDGCAKDRSLLCCDWSIAQQKRNILQRNRTIAQANRQNAPIIHWCPWRRAQERVNGYGHQPRQSWTCCSANMLLWSYKCCTEHVPDWRPIVRVDYEVFGVFLCFLSKQKYNLVASFE